MKRIAAALVLVMFPISSPAEELPIPQTVTGAWEMAVSASSVTDRVAGYDLVFREVATKKVIGTAETIGNYTNGAVAADTCKVVWHPTGGFVAFSDRATKHSLELYVYSLRNGKPEKILVPDYVMNALGRVDATEIALHCVSTPVSWEGDLLKVSLHFSVDRAETGRHFYNCEATLRLYHGESMQPSLGLLSVSAPKEAG